MSIINDATAGIVLLAGGRSIRMGSDKWLLPIEEKTVLEQIIGALQPLGTEIWIIAADAQEAANRDKFPNLAVHYPEIHLSHDRIPGIGPLGGLAAGLKLCTTSHILVAATDMPFPSTALAQALISLAVSSGAEAVVPMWKERMHPLFAVYNKSCLAGLMRYIEGGGRKVMDWVNGLEMVVLGEKQIEQLDPEGIALFNMNRPEDYQLVLELMQSKHKP